MSTTHPTEYPPTPILWRLSIGTGVVLLTLFTALSRSWVGPHGQAFLGLFCLVGVAATFSSNLRAVNWRTIGVGFALQLALALFILKTPVGKDLFQTLAGGVRAFLDLSNVGAKFVFGPLIDNAGIEKAMELKPGQGFIFAFTALPTIIFVSTVFSILYFLGILQLIVRIMARIMMYLMGTSGAESLSSTANVFMRQTEAPMIVRPYVRGMTESELLALMAGGMATVSGGMLAVYASPAIGADAQALLATSVMAAPCALYLSKLVIPETGEPLTRGVVRIEADQSSEEETSRNVIDAAARGATQGLQLALNVAAMLIAFVALVALVNALLGLCHENLSLASIFGVLFWPVAMVIGVEGADISRVADLLGQKLTINEMVAFLSMNRMGFEAERSKILATYALTGFANLGSVGIQLGGIGAMAPSRRSDLARLGMKALFVGFLATLVNAALVGILI